MVHNFVKENIA